MNNRKGIWSFILLFIVIALTMSCSEEKKKISPWPSLVMNESQKEAIIERAGKDAYIPIMDSIKARLEVDPDDIVNDSPDYNFDREKELARPALANAFIAYLYDDTAAAAKSIEFLQRLRTDMETCTTWDANIRMGELTFCAVGAWDLLKGGGFMTETEETDIRKILCDLTDSFYNKYTKSTMGQKMLQPTQNNHMIHTATVIAPAALIFSEEAEEKGWKNFAFYELGYMFSPEGLYIQADGGVSESPLYFAFAMRGALPIFMALKNAGIETLEVNKDCSLYGIAKPWNENECIEGESYTFTNPLDGELLPKAVDWLVKVRMPDGKNPPIDDGRFGTFNESWIYSNFYEDSSHLIWHLENNPENPSYYSSEAGVLDYMNIFWTDPSAAGTEPSWSPTIFFPDGGQAVFRSGWGTDDIWFLMQSEKAPARMTLHDHIDNGAFQMYAYGEYLLMDPGYWKPRESDNARTAHAGNHNMILVDGDGPMKGKLAAWLDQSDAYLENTYDGATFDYAESRTSYRDTDIVRSALFVRNRYMVIADDIKGTGDHIYTWRIHGYGHQNKTMDDLNPADTGDGTNEGDAGYIKWIKDDMRITDLANTNYATLSGGTFNWLKDDGTTLPNETGAAGGRWERTKAGVDVYVDSTSLDKLTEAEKYGKDSNAWVQWNDLGSTGLHYVYDAESTSIDDTSFLAVIFPYNKISPSDNEKAGTVTRITGTDLGIIGYVIESGDGKKDVALINENGGTVTIDTGIGEVTTDARFTLISDIGGEKSAFAVRGKSIKINDGVLTTITMDKSDSATFSYKE